ncbi:glycosyltransferase family 4 protein, partial [Bacteroidota bacterium]
ETIKIYNSHPLAPALIGTRKNQIVFIATMKSFKHPELFCDIAGNLIDSYYNFIIIGENYSDLGKAQKLLSFMDENKIMYRGIMELSEVNKLLAETKLFVNTSSEEGFPNTFIQAWLRGVPVVSLNVDPDNLIREERLGFVCNGDINTAVEKISYLMENEDIWEEYSSRCYTFAINNFDLKKTVKTMIEIFTMEPEG